ncbi:MAG: hypothetical protein PQJ58_10540 [Spirochaetales bacterium]|nr:hypothetical protein [Spirochaetales bacterium]
MLYSVIFTRDKQTSGWSTETGQLSLAGIKDLIDKAMFVAGLKTKYSNKNHKLTLSDEPGGHHLKLELIGQDYYITDNKLFSGHGTLYPDISFLFGIMPETLYMTVETADDFPAEDPDENLTMTKKKDRWNDHLSPFE